MDFCEIINNKENTEMIFRILTLIIMILTSVYDIRDKKIPVSIPAELSILSIIHELYLWSINAFDIKEMLLSFMPGVILIAVCMISQQSVGLGDGLIVFAIGPVFGMLDLVLMIFIALVLSGIIGGILLVLKKVNGRSTLPFIPFLSTGMGVMCFAFL